MSAAKPIPSQGRVWKMWAHDYGDQLLDIIEDKKLVELYGIDKPIVRVDVIEDDDGDHLGWIDTGDTSPEMIYHNRVFEICFAYGSKVEVERGKGVVVKLTIKKSIITQPWTDKEKAALAELADTMEKSVKDLTPEQGLNGLHVAAKRKGKL